MPLRRLRGSPYVGARSTTDPIATKMYASHGLPLGARGGLAFRLLLFLPDGEYEFQDIPDPQSEAGWQL